MSVRIVMADESEARFYDIGRPRARRQLADRIENPIGRLGDRDLKSDRPGRVFDRAPTAGKRRAAVAHHATGGERRPHKQATQRVARQVAPTLAHEAFKMEDKLSVLLPCNVIVHETVDRRVEVARVDPVGVWERTANPALERTALKVRGRLARVVDVITP